MALDVKVKIDLIKPVGKMSFGYPLILSVGEAKDYTECKNIDAVVAAGFAESTDVYKAAALMFSQNNPPQKIAVCGVATTTDLGAIKEQPWRQLVTVGELEASDGLAAIVSYIAATPDKMYFATAGSVSGLAALGDSERVIGFVHTDDLAAAALAGEAAGREVGSFTYKNLILNGIEPMASTDEEIDAIHKANGFTFVTKAGDNVTTEGIVMSGEYVDIIDCKDYVIQQLEYKTQKLLNNSAKIPYDNNGIAMLESVCVDVMRDAFDKGMIATGEDGKPAYSVTYDLVENVEPADKVARKYVGGKFNFTLSGALHTVDIYGEIII